MGLYKVSFSGFAYVEANSEEEAEEKFHDDEYFYQDLWTDETEEVQEAIIDL